jgi:hypothetical protein
LLDEDAAHGLGGSGEKVTAAVPALERDPAHEPQVRFMDKGGGLKCLPRFLLGQSVGSELAQFLVHQRQQLPRSGRIALLDVIQDAGNFAHGHHSGLRALRNKSILLQIDAKGTGGKSAFLAEHDRRLSQPAAEDKLPFLLRSRLARSGEDRGEICWNLPTPRGS